MNGTEVKWLKEMFKQHNKDQQKYLDAKFEGLGDKIDNLADDIDDVEAVCSVALDDIEEKVEENEKKTNKKIVIGSAGAIILTILLWTALGTDALAILLKMVVGLPF